MGYFSKENREKRRRRKEAKRLAKSIKGSDDPRATLETIRKLGVRDEALAQSYLNAAAAEGEGDVRNGLVMLFLKELYGSYDHDWRKKIVQKNIGAIERICGREVLCDEVKEETKQLRDRNEIQSRIIDYDKYVGQAVGLLLAASYSILANGSMSEADMKRAQRRKEKEAKERARAAREHACSLAKGECEDPGSALEAIGKTPEWQAQMVADLLVFAANNEGLRMDALALSLIGLRTLPEKERTKATRYCGDALGSILGDGYEAGRLEEQGLAYLADQGYGDNEFWSKALEWNGRSAGAVKVLFEKGEEGWDILVGNLDAVKNLLKAEKGFILYALQSAGTVRAKLTALDMLEKAGYADVESHDALFELFGREENTDVAARAFELLVKREEEARGETVDALLIYGSARAEDDPSRYRGLLEHLTTRTNGVVREGVLASILASGDQQGMEILADSFGDLEKAFAELGAEAAERAVINALRNGIPASRNAAFDFAASMEEPSDALLEEVAEQLGNGNGKAALGVFISQGHVPSGYEDQVLAAVESDDQDRSVMAMIAYSKCDMPNMRDACERMLAKHGDGEHWMYLLMNKDEAVNQAVVDGLYPLREQGGWEPLIRFDHEIENEEMEEVLKWGMNAEDRKVTAYTVYRRQDEEGEIVTQVESEEKTLRAASFERISWLREINDSDLLAELAAQVKDPEYRESALRIMGRTGLIPNQQMGDLVELVKGDDVESAVKATQLLSGVQEKTDEIVACLKDAATSSRYKKVRMTAMAMLPGSLPQMADDDEMLGMLKDLAIEVEPDELSSIARVVLARFSMPQVTTDVAEIMQAFEVLSNELDPDEAQGVKQAMLASLGEPQGKAGRIINELLELAEEKIETGDPEELAWVCRTTAELKEAGIPRAQEFLMERLIPEFIETVTEDREEHEDMYVILIGRYGSLDNILAAMENGGLIPGKGNDDELIQCEDGSYLTEREIRNADNSEALRYISGAFLVSREDELNEWLSRDENEHMAEEVRGILGIEETDPDDVMVDMGQVRIINLSEIPEGQFELDSE